MVDIHSGDTNKKIADIGTWIGAMQENIQEDACFETFFELEDMLSSQSIYDLIDKMNIVPFYRFLVYYLVYQHKNELGISTEEQLEACIEAVCRALQDKKAETADKQYCKQLTQFMMEDMVSNGVAQKKDKTYSFPSDLRGKWKDKQSLTACQKFFFRDSMQAEQFFVLAIGLHMTLEDINLFLTKALRRTALDFWNIEEVLVYLYTQCHVQEDRELGFFYDTLAQYDSLEPEKTEKEISLARDARAQTQVLQDQAKQFVETMKEREIDAVSNSFLTFLRQYKQLVSVKNGYLRSRNKMFLDMKAQLEKNTDIALKNIKEVDKEAAVIKHQRDMVQVYYRAGSHFTIPENTKLTCDFEGKLQSFVTFKEVSTAMDTTNGMVEQEVCVTGTMKNTGGALTAGTVCSCPSLPKISEIVVKSKFKLNAGKLYVRCPGTLAIPEGTIFVAPDGNQYESVEAVPAAYAVSGQDIRCLNVDVRCEIEGDCARKNSAFGLTDPIAAEKDIIAIYNKQQIGRLNIKREEEKKKTQMRLYEMLYGGDVGFEIDASCAIQLFGKYDAKKCMEKLKWIMDGHRFTDTYFFNVSCGKVTVDRDALMTMAFLLEMSKNEEILGDMTSAEVMQGIAQTVSDRLTECGFHRVYLPNPYDCLLVILCACDEPLQLYRTLWSCYKLYFK